MNGPDQIVQSHWFRVSMLYMVRIGHCVLESADHESPEESRELEERDLTVCRGERAHRIGPASVAHGVGAALAIGCSGAGEPALGQLNLTISGYGCVAVPLSNSTCEGGICLDSACNPGLTSAAYDARTRAVLTPQADVGWHFVGWTVNVYGGATNWSSFTSTDADLIVQNTGTQLDVAAMFAPDM